MDEPPPYSREELLELSDFRDCKHPDGVTFVGLALACPTCGMTAEEIHFGVHRGPSPLAAAFRQFKRKGSP